MTNSFDKIRNIAIKLAVRRGGKALPPTLGHREASFPY
jgi:hypothetical protein